ncbi:MAG: glycosyltransferase [Chloroflexi bacterium]|nr:glycosyltransferase [Chloroflexota bacterium]
MKVSVITVCYNAEVTIEETLKSVLSQTYDNIEYLVVDGGSTDNTVPIIQRYSDRLAYFVSEKDSGMYEAMNKGISAATGHYLFFLNADDVFFDDSVVEDAAKEFLGLDVDLLFGDVFIVDRATGTSFLKSHGGLDKPFFLGNCICQQGIFYKADAFRKCGTFDQTYRIVGDYEWLLRALFKYKLPSKYISVPFAIFRWGGICNSNRFEELHVSERERVIRSYFSNLEIRLQRSSKLHRLARRRIPRRAIWRIFRWELR